MNEDLSSGSGSVARATAAPAPLPPLLSEDDMIDTPEECDRWPFLTRTLGGCRDQVIKTYVEADRASCNAQEWHQRWVILAAFSATLAVTLAIIQLSRGFPSYIRYFELSAVAAALVSFSLGDKTRRKWLTERHKAERCRLLKFSSLIFPVLYQEDAVTLEDCAGGLGRHVDSLKNLTYGDLEQWLDDDTLPSPPGRISRCSLPELKELRDYYCEKRLAFQANYFKRQANRNVRRDRFWRKMLPWFFLGSAVAVVIHLIIPVLPAVSGYHDLEFLALFGAALLPVFSSGIRTWRSAREATRNINRFRAKWVALDNISRQLARDDIKDDAGAEIVLRDLWCAEQIMESEHREWLRLMTEAEWVG